ncbi:MAG: hypothetical protein HQL44_17065 [Alphaproteobacteria bacterium]|nr:hypothetical protein [Alphaproteobacteria bacterium]
MRVVFIQPAAQAIQRAVDAARAEIDALIAQARQEHTSHGLGGQQACYAALLAAKSGIDCANPFNACMETYLHGFWNNGIAHGMSAQIPCETALPPMRIARTHAAITHEHDERDNAA